MRMDLQTLLHTWGWICGHCYLHEDGFADVATYMRMDLRTLLPTWGWFCGRRYLQEDRFADVATYMRMVLRTLISSVSWSWSLPSFCSTTCCVILSSSSQRPVDTDVFASGTTPQSLINYIVVLKYATCKQNEINKRGNTALQDKLLRISSTWILLIQAIITSSFILLKYRNTVKNRVEYRLYRMFFRI